MKNLILGLVFISTLFTSCETVIDPEITPGPERIVVDGKITDWPGVVDTIYISFSNSNFDRNEINYGNEVIAYITDSENGSDTLEFVGKGKYIADVKYKAKVGVEYVLHIVTSTGKKYKSDAVSIHQVPFIDSIYTKLTWDYYTELGWQKGLWPEYNTFAIHLDFLEDQGVGDYYKWDVFVNDKLATSKDNYFIVADYQFGLEGEYWENLIRYEDIYFKEGDKVQIHHQLIQKGEYDFYISLLESIPAESVGAIFDNPPGAVITNVYNEGDSDELCIGRFSAVSMQVLTIDIPKLPEGVVALDPATYVPKKSPFD